MKWKILVLGILSTLFTMNGYANDGDLYKGSTFGFGTETQGGIKDDLKSKLDDRAIRQARKDVFIAKELRVGDAKANQKQISYEAMQQYYIRKYEEQERAAGIDMKTIESDLQKAKNASNKRMKKLLEKNNHYVSEVEQYKKLEKQKRAELEQKYRQEYYKHNGLDKNGEKAFFDN